MDDGNRGRDLGEAILRIAAVAAGRTAVRAVEVLEPRLRQDQALPGGDRVGAPEREVLRSHVDGGVDARQRRAREIVDPQGARVPAIRRSGIGHADEDDVRGAPPRTRLLLQVAVVEKQVRPDHRIRRPEISLEIGFEVPTRVLVEDIEERHKLTVHIDRRAVRAGFAFCGHDNGTDETGVTVPRRVHVRMVKPYK